MNVLALRRSAFSTAALASVLAAGVQILSLPPAAAQMTMPGGALANTGPLGALNSPGKSELTQPAGGAQNATPKPPDALPGAKSSAPVVPATRPAADMSPNDALFDAINRGDVVAVRDALSRGADLDARNVLGMTPMELSVDLGRNDISFVLLSMRAQDSSPAPPAASAPTTQSLMIGSRSPTAARRAPTPVRVTQAPPPRPAVEQPRLFANDGGNPNPGVGFLGFGSSAR